MMTEPDSELNILLIEDDRVDVMNVKRAFAKSHITNPIYVAENGIKALEMLRGGEVPLERLLILLDLNMPRMTGIEFLRELRADEKLARLPVVVVSTSAADSDRIDAYDLNVAGYVVKPVTFERFVETMVTLNKYWTLVELP